MINSFFLQITLFLFTHLAFAFDLESKQNVALYWGQNSGGTQQSLGSYCESTDADIYLLSFLYQFPKIGLDLASACTSSYSDGVLHCSQIAQDIEKCQSLGKKVLLSLGGASGAYGFTDENSAREFAHTLWDTFGEGTGNAERPFDSAIVDGFDFDIENNNAIGYAALVKELKTLFGASSKKYYVSAAPQCPYPDASVGDLLKNADVDFAFIQFYNNYCNVDKSFNWDTWQDYAQSVSPNKNIKLYLGLPGSATAASTGYISDLSLLQDTISKVSSSGNFGGVAMWDASQAFSNKIGGQSYVSHIKKILGGSAGGSFTTTLSSSSSPSPSPSASSTSVPTATTDTFSSTDDLSLSTTISIAATTNDVVTSLTTATTSASSSEAKTTVESNDPLTTTVPVSSTVERTTLQPTTIAPVSSTVDSTPSQPITTVSSTVERTTLQPTTTVPVSSTVKNTPAQPSAQATATASAAHAKAVSLNALYASGKYNGEETCTDGSIACSASGEFAICNFGAWVNMACASGTTCFASESSDILTIGCNFSSQKQLYIS